MEIRKPRMATEAMTNLYKGINTERWMRAWTSNFTHSETLHGQRSSQFSASFKLVVVVKSESTSEVVKLSWKMMNLKWST